MCGIVGYVGKRGARDIIFSGLKSLEYRGYDSAGIALMESEAGKLATKSIKAPGKLDNLKGELATLSATAAIGIGHTRWATHGEANQVNSHPHRVGPVTIVHNGIIENHGELRRDFSQASFKSETDSEVFAHLVAGKRKEGKSLFEAVRTSFLKLDGNSAFVVMDEATPDTIIAIRKGASPLVVGVGANESLVASDVPALLRHTRDVYYLNEDEIAVLTHDGVKLFGTDGKERSFQLTRIDWDAGAIDKHGYPHFMLKEIFEQPRAVEDTLRPWLDSRGQHVKIRVNNMTPEAAERIFREAGGVQVVACGTAFHACLYGQMLLEKYARIPARAELAHEYRYRDPVFRASDIGIVVSQSGETADLLAAAKLMRKQGMKVFCITNVPGSSIVRECDGAFFMNAGIEVSVASTKAFMTMMAVFAALAVGIGRARGALSAATETEWAKALEVLPKQIEATLKEAETYRKLAERYRDMKGYLYIGRGPYYGIALEGALKLKELAYVHAEGFAGGELKHGPIALVEKDMLIVAIAPEGDGEMHAKSISNVEEVRARKGTILGIGREQDAEFAKLASDYVGLPTLAVRDLYPLLAVVPLQLLAYHISAIKGCEVDQPRNLAKSVTVE